MKKPKKKIALLGSTGSIGTQTLEIIRNHPDNFQIIALAAGKNNKLLAQQIAEFKPLLVYSTEHLNLPDETKFITMENIASHPDIDLVIVATAGIAGLLPTLSAIKSAKQIALANKEVLVTAGEIIMAEAKRYKCQILPIDSEHSAIWQCLNGENNNVSRIILTASGGPFLDYTMSQLCTVTVAETLKHPTWKMGKKVTVDSATLMNKGLEVIEAKWLFDIPIQNIEIIIHPKSIIHSLVEFIDGSMKAQLSYPDMHLPIQYALSYPERFHCNFKQLDLANISSLDFQPVNYDIFPCLLLALEAGKNGGTYPTVLCTADEIAVELFLSGQIKYPAIAEIIADLMQSHVNISHPSLDDILAADSWTREKAREVAKKRSIC